jgi:hypothetical protein
VDLPPLARSFPSGDIARVMTGPLCPSSCPTKRARLKGKKFVIENMLLI